MDMQNQPVIQEENQNNHHKQQEAFAPMEVQHKENGVQQNGKEEQNQQSSSDEDSEVQEKIEHQVKQENKIDQQINQPDITENPVFSFSDDLIKEQQNLNKRQRKTRWGERQIKRSRIQEDAVFNPLQALYSGNSLLPITQYGQAQLQIKMSLYHDGKKRKSKWHHEIQKTFIPPILNYVSPNLSLDEIQYILRLYRLDQLTSIINNYIPEDQDIRSPSPQPIYDSQGKRINTRQVRKRDQLHRQRISLIQDCMKMRSTFIPPQDYKPLKKFKKIYLSESAVNDSKANYIGKIIGPQGSTQKLIEKRSGCKIAVRGRGANKNQKDIFQNFQALHIIIVADTNQQLDKGVEQVQKILNGEEDEEIKAMLEGLNSQLMGVFNDNYCQNCQQEGHRTWACPFGMKNKLQIRCQICQQTSHPTSDCPQKQAYLKKQQNQTIAMLLESQYHQFKSDLDEKPKPKGGLAFITDIDRKQLLAIGSSQPNKYNSANQNNQQNKGAGTKKQAQQEIQNNDLPKFQDD